MKRVLIGILLLSLAATGWARRPNVVFIVPDDMKRAHHGFIEGKALTPNIDRLANEGVFFSRAYATTSVCTPSRFTSLTGRYASRCGQLKPKGTERVYNVQWNTPLTDEVHTLPKLLQKAGYATGMVGKWHNGHPENWFKITHSFDRDDDPADPKVAAKLKKLEAVSKAYFYEQGFDYADGLVFGNLGSHFLRKLRYHNQEWFTKAAVDFISANKDKPFFLYMATTLMHGPGAVQSINADPRATAFGYLEKPITVQPPRKDAWQRGLDAGHNPHDAAATWLDDGIGAIMKHLETLGLAEDTLIVYFNDHGTDVGKGSCYEGGVRTPSMVYWPGRIKPGVSDALVQNTDFVPTILEACGVPMPADMVCDGKSLWPILDRRQKAVRDYAFCEMGYTRAVITRDWKYLAFRIPPSATPTKEQRREMALKMQKWHLEAEDRHVPAYPDAPLSHLAFPGGMGTERPVINGFKSTYYDPDQLYRLTPTPQEHKNLAGDPEYAAVLAGMKAKMREAVRALPGNFGEFGETDTKSVAVSTTEARRPNFVVILSDDVGFEEHGIYGVKKGEPSNTPRIDRLAERGVAFQTAWTQSLCGPSRAMLYTGNYAPANGSYDNKIDYRPGRRKDLPFFTRVLHDAGYTTAVAGKWHNPNPGVVGLHNDQLGVDRYCVWYSYPERIKEITGRQIVADGDSEIAPLTGKRLLSRYWKPTMIRDGRLLETRMEDYGPDMFADYICEFIRKQAKSDRPFLAFYPMVLAHSAHCVTPIDVAAGATPANTHYAKGKPEGAKIFKNQVAYIDRLVGRVVDAVEAAGVADNTIIIYASDNGTTASSKGKGVEYGVHVPFVVAGPGIKRRGLAAALMDFTDVLPTLADFAGAEIPANQPVAGVSLKPFLTGTSEETKDVIYAHPGISTLVRTRDYLLEAVCPLYGQPRGRFYRTHGSYDGRGYENVTHDPEHAKMRKAFDGYLACIPSLLPESFDDPVWQEKLRTGFKHFDSEGQRRHHLSLPHDYKPYDPSF